MIETLKISPLFNHSLANKELFHSNFIAWFGKLYPGLFISRIVPCLPIDKRRYLAWFNTGYAFVTVSKVRHKTVTN
jgi:hypothetical protein